MTDKLTSPVSSVASKEKEVFTLHLRKQPPSHVFSGETFEIDFGLERASTSSSSDNSPPLPTNLGLKLVLLQGEGTLFVLEEARISATRRTGKCKCRIECEQPSKPFKIKLFNDILSCVSNEIQVVTAKIRIKADNWNPVWYKDEGGRDKCMEVTVGAYNAQNELMEEKVPLDLTLCYASRYQVSNQDLFRTLGKTSQLEGLMRLRFRIEDVSKNHQGQDFCLKVAARSTLYAPGYTPTVSVRSKRNKRQRSGRDSLPPTASSTHRQTGSDPIPLPLSRLQEQTASQSPQVEGQYHQLVDAIRGVSAWAEETVQGLYQHQWHILGYAQHPDGSPDYNRPYHSMPNPNPLISRVLGMYSESVRQQIRLLEQSIVSTPREGHSSSFFGFHASMQHPSSASMPPTMGRGGASPPSLMGPPRQQPPPRHPADLAQASSPPQMDPLYRDYSVPFYPRPAQTTPTSHAHFAAPYSYQQRTQPMPVAEPRRLDESDPSQDVVSGRTSAEGTASRKSDGTEEIDDDEDRLQEERLSGESDVEYVLAKQYKSLRTGERLGFPAYSIMKQILGFFREGQSGRPQFVPISAISEVEIEEQAPIILQQAMDSKSDAVYALRDWGTIGNLMDHALVYEWSKNIESSGSSSSNNNGGPAAALP